MLGIAIYWGMTPIISRKQKWGRPPNMKYTACKLCAGGNIIPNVNKTREKNEQWLNNKWYKKIWHNLNPEQ